ncbi:DNA polymerase III subunit delta [Pseudoalteromonas sp. N1230-9]|uniref:DNA polymerase III subunit delta n=1 Tax=unclassified Pseudoalteromonas TaxID=194690 RepID=UPI0010235926|nr:DNA polymerase III subunit delta [Pseudoalteromonas sp. CO302Y]RZG07592.1 DNA polymerase III subunit delta [Pseudoalteromonas sp. CO133X]WOC27473.1 DNA polymerase III subunit delta [Pseudoalteromonas sp. N1230-9]
MRCYANQLPSQLKKGLAPFYMVFGEEPYQITQCIMQIRQTAKQQGFDEVIKFTLMPGFDWQEIIAQYQSMSLFSARTLIEFDLNEQKPGTQGSQIFKQLVELVNPDTILVLKGAKAGQDIQRSAWFKALDKQGVFVPCYPLTGNHLSRWLDEQCDSLNLNLHNNAKQSLIDATEGNLLACHQELEKLSLLYGSDLVDQQAVMQGLLNQSKFDIFDLSHALLQGQSEQVVKIMSKLADDNTEAMSIFWAINKEAASLLAMQHGRLNGANMADLYKQFNIWKNQQATTQQALNRLNIKALEQITKHLAQFDAAYKQGNLVAPYQALTHICLVFCQPVEMALPCHPAFG